MPKSERPFYQDPARYLEHLKRTPQLPAPPEVLLLSSVALSIETQEPSFDDWLTTTLGQAVIQHIIRTPNAPWLSGKTSYFDTIEDVQQNALIYLWERWQHDPTFFKDTVSFQTITNIALSRGRNKYARRKREGREQQVQLMFEPEVAPFASQTDLKIDVDAAVERVVKRMVMTYSIAEGNYRRVPIEKITRTIIQGYRFYYVDRYSNKGGLYHFCEQNGVSRYVIQKWRPIIFQLLCEELANYAPDTYL